jgi:hypothetical protein
MKKYKVICMNVKGTPRYLCHYTVSNGKHEWKGASSEVYCQKLADRINRMKQTKKG